MKAAFYDPNPVVILEHKGLYWSKIKGTASAKTIEPCENYKIPLGKGRTVLKAKDKNSVYYYLWHGCSLGFKCGATA